MKWRWAAGLVGAVLAPGCTLALDPEEADGEVLEVRLVNLSRSGQAVGLRIGDQVPDLGPPPETIGSVAPAPPDDPYVAVRTAIRADGTVPVALLDDAGQTLAEAAMPVTGVSQARFTLVAWDRPVAGPAGGGGELEVALLTLTDAPDPPSNRDVFVRLVNVDPSNEALLVFGPPILILIQRTDGYALLFQAFRGVPSPFSPPLRVPRTDLELCIRRTGDGPYIARYQDTAVSLIAGKATTVFLVTLPGASSPSLLGVNSEGETGTFPSGETENCRDPL